MKSLAGNLVGLLRKLKIMKGRGSEISASTTARVPYVMKEEWLLIIIKGAHFQKLSGPGAWKTHLSFMIPRNEIGLLLH